MNEKKQKIKRWAYDLGDSFLANEQVEDLLDYEDERIAKYRNVTKKRIKQCRQE